MKRISQVHCLLDCYASVIEDDGRFDFRPLYIGVWNAYFEANEKGIFYCSDKVDLKDWDSRFAMLYGNSCKHWYEGRLKKQENYSRLLDFMQDGGKVSIILVDVFFLPYSHQYRSKHAPHYVIVNHGQENKCRIKDRYFDWEGCISQQDLSLAFGFKGFNELRTIDKGALQCADEQTVIHMFETELRSPPGRLLVEVERFVHNAVNRNGGYAPKSLFASIQEAGVIAKRYGGYHYALQYLVSKSSGIDDSKTASTIAELIKGWENFMLTLARYPIVNKPVDLESFTAKGEALHNLELAVSKELLQVFMEWQEKTSIVVSGELSCTDEKL
jgi:hypothetical protein